MEKLTAKEIAKKFGVAKRVAQSWILNGLFPHAQKETISPFGEVWFVPASDLNNFKRPERGRPKIDNPSPAAISKRNLRAGQKEKNS
ncbi:MAG: helix-turn-helix domain-containing protein [Pyrinomonadaceae bacterium]